MPRLPVIGDLLEYDQHLAIWCHWPGCERHVRMPAAEAVAKLGPTTTYQQAAQRLWCTACGNRGRDNRVTCRPCTLDGNDIRHGRQPRASPHRK